jgi:hypothetical protein
VLVELVMIAAFPLKVTILFEGTVLKAVPVISTTAFFFPDKGLIDAIVSTCFGSSSVH